MEMNYMFSHLSFRLSHSLLPCSNLSPSHLSSTWFHSVHPHTCSSFPSHSESVSIYSLPYCLLCFPCYNFLALLTSFYPAHFCLFAWFSCLPVSQPLPMPWLRLLFIFSCICLLSLDRGELFWTFIDLCIWDAWIRQHLLTPSDTRVFGKCC